jgi:hypothetical protein
MLPLLRLLRPSHTDGEAGSGCRARRSTATATAGRRICRHITIAGSEAVLAAGEGFEDRVSEVVLRGVRTEIGQSIGQLRK